MLQFGSVTTLTTSSSRRAPKDPLTRETLAYNFTKRRKHLRDYIPQYDRVADILFATVIDRTKHDLNTRLIRVKYNPNARVMNIAIAWDRSDAFPRNVGSFCLYRDGIFEPNDIVSWPKVQVAPGWRKISDMSDDDIVEAILTSTGFPDVSKFAVPPEAGAIRHESKRLLRIVDTLHGVVASHHLREISDLKSRVEDFAYRVGATA